LFEALHLAARTTHFPVPCFFGGGLIDHRSGTAERVSPDRDLLVRRPVFLSGRRGIPRPGAPGACAPCPDGRLPSCCPSGTAMAPYRKGRTQALVRRGRGALGMFVPFGWFCFSLTCRSGSRA